MKRISNLKFIVKNITMSPSPSVTKKNNPSQCLPHMISSGDSAKNPLVGFEEKKKNHHHHHQVLERRRPQVKYSTWDEILRKTKRIDYDQVDDSAVKGSSSSVFKGSSPSVFNLKGKPPLGMNSSTAKPNKTVNVVPRKSSTAHHQADVPVPVLVRGKSNHHDFDSRHMQFKAKKAPIFPYKRPRNQDDNGDNETSALNLKRRKTTFTSSGVKPKPAESPQTSANSCQTVVSSCRISKKAVVDLVNDSSDASSVIPADKQPEAVLKNAAAHSNTVGEISDINSSAQDDDCCISPIIDEDTRKGWLTGSLWKKLSRITRKGELPGSPWRR